LCTLFAFRALTFSVFSCCCDAGDCDEGCHRCVCCADAGVCQREAACAVQASSASTPGFCSNFFLIVSLAGKMPGTV
jgi:hypothetical protein